MATSDQMGQHKRLAMGKPVNGLKMGGAVTVKTGMKDSPLTMAKRENGVPGFKAGGKVKGKGC